MLLNGELQINRPLKHWHQFYLTRFVEMRHVKRDKSKIPDHWLLKQVKLPAGIEGQYFIPGSNPIINCNIKNYKDFLSPIQKVILTLFCIHRFHYNQIDKNVFILITNYLIKDLFLSDNQALTENGINDNIMSSYSAFESCVIFEVSTYERLGLVDYKKHPSDQPYRWCSWKIDNKSITISEEEGLVEDKYFHSLEWLRYLINNFFNRWNYILDGELSYQYSRGFERGYIVVNKNDVKIIASDDKNTEEDSSENTEDSGENTEDNNTEEAISKIEIRPCFLVYK